MITLCFKVDCIVKKLLTTLLRTLKSTWKENKVMNDICITMILCSVLNGLIIGAFIMGASDNYKRKRN